MRAAPLMLAVLAVAAAAVGATPAPAAARFPFRATLTAPTHRPRVNVKWYYTVRVRNLDGRPVRARITVLIRDPLGTLHPVLYANTRRKLVDWPIDGRFRDYVVWPRSSAVGISLTLLVTVRVGTHRKVLNYRVTPVAGG